MVLYEWFKYLWEGTRRNEQPQTSNPKPMGIWKQIAEYLYIKKRDPNETHAVDEIHARHEPYFTDHVPGGGADHYF
jgi:hypothetical protein